MNRDQLVSYLNDYLKVHEIKDASDNGLQVEGGEEVHKVAFAVDACLEAFRRTHRADAQMLIAHHGLFWGKPLMLSHIHRQRAAYLRLLDLKTTGTFGDYNGVILGVIGEPKKPLTLDRLVKSLEQKLAAKMTVLHHGPQEVRRVGIISGGAASMVEQAAEAGADLYLTGDPSHSAYHHIAERGMNVVYGGHYATETLGVKALAKHLGEKFELETEFLDIPTGF